MMEQFKIEWIDRNREPQCEPNPDFPYGIAIDTVGDVEKKCIAKLPYPARRCGLYMVECRFCKILIAVTTAGRIDDPVSVAMECKAIKSA